MYSGRYKKPFAFFLDKKSNKKIKKQRSLPSSAALIIALFQSCHTVPMKFDFFWSTGFCLSNEQWSCFTLQIPQKSGRFSLQSGLIMVLTF
ncbi:MAG: hypothetical protein NTX97_10390, partial [Bacteroidetes bacterium]|nr:hypothetical protein [Bacteroidota bacterium]